MAKKSDRERSAFGLRLLRAREAAGLSQKAVQAAIGIPQSTLAELETTSSSSGYTAQLADLYGVSAVYLATGETPHQVRGVAQDMSLARHILPLPITEWGDLPMLDLSQPFQLEVRDGAFGDDYPVGCVMRLDPKRPPRAGWPLLVKDDNGNFYLRDYQAGAGERWKAVARVRGFDPLDSVDDGLKIIAVMKGVEYP